MTRKPKKRPAAPPPDPEPDKPLTVMVASSVYGFEETLDQIITLLRSYGYRVLNSHGRTIPPHPGRSNRDNCLAAVRQADLFLGIIRPSYGTGVIGARSITHDEMRLAVELNKPRWFLAHENVVVARQLLRPFLKAFETGKVPPPSLKGNPILDDLRILDMYNEIVGTDRPAETRTGNWVQPFRTVGEAMEYIQTCLGNVESVREIIEEMDRERDNS